MSEDSIAALFSKEVNHVQGFVANDMGRTLCAYYEAFKALRESAMNYETLPEYQEHFFIMQVPQDQYWPYTPHFRKFMCLAIQVLFQTKITSMEFSPVTVQKTIGLVDDHKNRCSSFYYYVNIQSGSSDINPSVFCRFESMVPSRCLQDVPYPRMIHHL
jgi:hypothetical protein